MKIGIVIHSNESETVWNAFRLGSYALDQGDEVKIFLLGKGVECEQLNTNKFNVISQMETFHNKSGEILACGTCLEIRKSEGSDICPISTMQDLYNIVNQSDKLLTF